MQLSLIKIQHFNNKNKDLLLIQDWDKANNHNSSHSWQGLGLLVSIDQKKYFIHFFNNFFNKIK